MPDRFRLSKRKKINRRTMRERRIFDAWWRIKKKTNFFDNLWSEIRKRRLHCKLFDFDVLVLRRKARRRLPKRPMGVWPKRHQLSWCRSRPLPRWKGGK